MRYLISVVVATFLLVNSAAACQCMQLERLSFASIAKYDIIFLGQVIAISDDDIKSRASFRVTEVYKGKSYPQIELEYDGATDCSMNFVPGETWIIYGKWSEYGIPRADMCGHSRVKMKDGQVDYYDDGIRGTYSEELKWLNDSLGIQAFIDPNDHKDLGHKNEIPGPGQAFGYLAAGLVGLGAIFFFVRRMFKRDAK